MLTLCWRHHRARHLGLLRIEGSAPDFEFVLLDGEVLEQSGSEGAFSYENSGFGSVPVGRSVSERRRRWFETRRLRCGAWG